MKLQAMTVCVHGAHLLSCSLSNRHQFDRWLIVTVPRDTETIALCRDNGLSVSRPAFCGRTAPTFMMATFSRA